MVEGKKPDRKEHTLNGSIYRVYKCGFVTKQAWGIRSQSSGSLWMANRDFLEDMKVFLGS